MTVMRAPQQAPPNAPPRNATEAAPRERHDAKAPRRSPLPMNRPPRGGRAPSTSNARLTRRQPTGGSAASGDNRAEQNPPGAHAPQETAPPLGLRPRTPSPAPAPLSCDGSGGWTADLSHMGCEVRAQQRASRRDTQHSHCRRHP